MLISPNRETYDEAKTALTATLLCETCGKLGLKNSERRQYAKFLITVTARYLELKRANPLRTYPSDQITIFKQHIKAAIRLKETYQKILDDRGAETKLHVSLRKLYKQQPTEMREMLSPYMNDGGYTKDIFTRFLDVLILATENAKTESVGNEDADLSSNYLAWWAGEIKLRWPTNSPIPFKLGSFISAPSKGKSKTSEYDSEACKLLLKLIKKVHKDTTEEQVETAMRKVIAEGENLYPAKYFLN